MAYDTLKAGLFTADYQPFNGNFGVFEDSLPGGYGEYLLRKVLKGWDVDPQTLNPVQWLSIVGSSGMGALCYVPETKLQHEDALLSLDEMQEMALNVYAHNMDDHARNFSFICREGKWSLAPAYDLTNDCTLGEHASTINYKGLPSDEDLITVGMNIHMSRERCQQIMEEVREGTKVLTNKRK